MSDFRLLDKLNVAVVCLDTFGSAIYVNDAWCRITGLSASASLDMGWLDTIAALDRYFLTGALHVVPNSSLPQDVEIQLDTSGDFTRRITAHIEPTVDDNDVWNGCLITFTEAGSGQTPERSHLSRSDSANFTGDWYKSLVRDSLEGICIHRKYKTYFVNETFARMLGYKSAREFLEAGDLLCHLPRIVQENPEREWARIEEHNMERFRRKVSFCKRDGSAIWVDVVGQAVEWEGEYALQLNIIDISRQVDTERMLRNMERRLRFAIKGSGIGFWNQDRAREEIVWSPELFELSGYESTSSVISADWFRSKIHPEDDAYLSAQLADQGRNDFDWVFRFRHADGDYRWWRCIGTSHRNVQGEVVEYAGAAMDVTEQKLAESLRAESLQKAEEAARTKADFLATMSHEIRTPLNSVIGMTNLLLDTELDEQQHRFARVANASGQHLLHLIGDILDFSKLEAGKAELEITNINLAEQIALAVDIALPACEGKDVVISSEVDDTLPPNVFGDEARLQQILINLLANAVKFTQKGSVTVKAEKVEAKDSNDQPLLRISVTDTGIGIPANRIDSLFDAFVQVDASTTRKFGGTGLGLAICRQLVELMNGRIGAESEPGIGSTFWVDLPLKAAPAETPSSQPSVRPVERTGLKGKVLVAEDNSFNQMLIRELILKFGLSVKIEDNGKSALAALKAGDYDLVLMDIQMPVMDGLEATRQIRNLPAPKGNIPVIALTANLDIENKGKMSEAGLTDYLAKPVNIETLRRLLERYLSAPRAGAA